MSLKNVWGFIKCLVNPSACQRTTTLLYEYVEGKLDDDTRQRLEKHLSDCPTCIRYVESYRRTITLTHAHGVPETEMPPALRQKLREFIHQNPNLR